MTEYSRSATGSYTLAATGNNVPIYLPFQPTLVKLTNYTAYGAFAEHGIVSAIWQQDMGQGTAAVLLNSGATPTLITDQVTSNGISTFGAGLALQFGPAVQIASIVKTTNVVTTATNHNLNTGDVVMLQGLYQSATTGMPQIAGIPFQVTVTAPTTFTIVWNMNQSNYTSLSGSPAGAYVKKVLYPWLYFPGWNVIEAITTGTTTTITTTTNHQYVVGQEIAFRVTAPWGTTQLNSLPNNTIPGSPIYGYVTSVTSPTVFVCSINSSSYTAFTTNPTVASVPGLTWPQVVAVGDINSGGTPYSGGALYPAPVWNFATGVLSTINGPAISGSFVNNTRQGFMIGSGASVTDASSNLSGTTADFVVWEAYYLDINL